MDVSEFGIKFSGPYIEKLKLSFRLLLSSILLATNHDVTVVLNKVHINSCKEDN